MAYFGGPRGTDESWRGLATAVGMWALRGASLFSLIERETGLWIGRVGPWIPQGALGPEVGWSMSPAAWGRGYATEAAAAVLDWVFDNAGWTEVIHCIDPANTPSIAVAGRLGSPFLRQDVEPDGKLVHVYGQSRDQWLARRGAAKGSAR